MKYMLLVYENDAERVEKMDERMPTCAAYAEAMKTGRYQLEAAVQSAHVVRRRTGRADWPAIERIYDVLLAITGSPVWRSIAP